MSEKGKKKRQRPDEDRHQPSPAGPDNHPQAAHDHEHDRDEAAETWALLARTYLKLDRAVTARLSSWDLTPAQFDVLSRLGAEPGISQQELADRLLVTKGNVSQLLARLEVRGLIRRKRDGRVVRVYLADDGRRLYDEVAEAYQSWIPEPFSALKPNQLRRLQKALRILDEQVGIDAGPGAERR